ncbi:MAG: hypothetical protein ABW072_17460 [Sedimenticola sp.]
MAANENSLKALEESTKKGSDKALSQSTAIVEQMEADVKRKIKDRTIGDLREHASYSGLAKLYGLPSTVKSQRKTSGGYGKLFNRVKKCEFDIKNPPIDPTVKAEYEAEIERLNDKIQFISGLNANLEDEVERLSKQLDDERKINSNKAKTAKQAADSEGKVTEMFSGKK